MFRQLIAFSIFISVFNFSAKAQLGKIPVAVTAAFAKQYPSAEQISYEDNISDYRVYFLADSVKWIAKYSSKGVWKGSEKEASYDQLSDDVKDGFQKSKYADWKIRSVSILLLTEKAGGGEQYRIKVSKGDLNKKYLYFNRMGRLVNDSMTL
jgi:hypothetical protein